MDVGLVSRMVPPLPPEEVCAVAYDRFMAEPTLIALPVVDGDHPVGLLKRTEFLIRLADRFGRPLFEKKPVTVLMDDAPFLVEHDTDIDTLNTLLTTSGQNVIQEGFIVVEQGRYRGLGTAEGLIHANMKKSADRMQALEHARVEAEAANKAKSNFLANMSHELRTPLNAIIGFSEFIIEGEETGRASDTVHYVRDIRDSGKHLLNVINSILDMSKLEASAFELREDYEDPLTVVDQSIRIMEAQAVTSNITLSIVNNCAPMDLYADLQVVRQILLNLLSNAIKFSPRDTEVVVVLSLNAIGNLEIEVRDHGPGLSDAELEDVMKPFVQADNSKTRNHEGTGLGLPLVNAFALAHGGSFRLESVLGKGTSAIVEFPAERCHFDRVAAEDDFLI